MNVITREYYADKIDHWLGRQQILVLTGQRRVGKSFMTIGSEDSRFLF